MQKQAAVALYSEISPSENLGSALTILTSNAISSIRGCPMPLSFRPPFHTPTHADTLSGAKHRRNVRPGVHGLWGLARTARIAAELRAGAAPDSDRNDARTRVPVRAVGRTARRTGVAHGAVGPQRGGGRNRERGLARLRADSDGRETRRAGARRCAAQLRARRRETPGPGRLGSPARAGAPRARRVCARARAA